MDATNASGIFGGFSHLGNGKQGMMQSQGDKDSTNICLNFLIFLLST
jgi:hypothetical protein